MVTIQDERNKEKAAWEKLERRENEELALWKKIREEEGSPSKKPKIESQMESSDTQSIVDNKQSSQEERKPLAMTFFQLWKKEKGGIADLNGSAPSSPAKSPTPQFSNSSKDLNTKTTSTDLYDSFSGKIFNLGNF